MRMIDADSLESKLPAHSNDSDHVMTRNFAVESFRALIKAEPTVTPSPVYAKGILLDRAVRYDLQNAFPKALLNLRLELIAYPARNTTVPLYGADTIEELNARIIEWCSREACKSYSPASVKYHLNGINQFCHTDFTRDGMEYIYTNLGNGICATITTKMTCSARRPALRFKASWKSSARLTAASSTLFATARSSDGC